MTQPIYGRQAIADLERLTDFLMETAPHEAEKTFDLIVSALAILAQHPLVGRRVDPQFRELVISRGRTGYVALYHHDPTRDEVIVHAIRHQREAGFSELA